MCHDPVLSQMDCFSANTADFCTHGAFCTSPNESPSTCFRTVFRKRSIGVRARPYGSGSLRRRRCAATQELDFRLRLMIDSGTDKNASRRFHTRICRIQVVASFGAGLRTNESFR